MLHESVLTKADIVLLFRELYNIERIQDIQLINEGSAGVYLVFILDVGKYILKEFRKGYPERSIVNEVDICS
ncbi:MAG: hypothetical protein PHC31_05865 [Clostridia bacterium]|nr:hypothetical protein [Clostridia bacterium]MDD3971426.1 hypothetical protein [Clostridia bacterium]